MQSVCHRAKAIQLITLVGLKQPSPPQTYAPYTQPPGLVGMRREIGGLPPPNPLGAGQPRGACPS